ncbi:alpha/beta fold hydrolase [Glutamicibacter creatinolyticus]|uniref:alpha/beta fold hydrolase n=1 Tax=Glutamicibacter creatinolyticus TaxID=162496 RepID=UPI0033F14A20
MAVQEISVNGTALHAEDTGEENLPPLLCLHSLFLDGRMFDGLASAAKGWSRVIHPDFRGQGQSDLHDVEEIIMELCAEDIEALVEKLGLYDVSMAAQAMGGAVSVRFISHNQEKHRALAMMGSSACAELDDQLDVFREWVNGVRPQAFTGSSLDETMDIMFGQTTQANPDQAEMVALWRNRIGELPKSLLPAMVGVVARKSALHIVEDISIPVLVFSGEEDQPRPPAWSDQVAELLPINRLERLLGIGHSNILEAPEVVIPSTLEFYDLPAKLTRVH